eukprot:Skav208659  [mRNA]  locus=scaffold357:129222:132561:- [translate_table: standard]
MATGLPGSGKSTFAQQLVKSAGHFERVCQAMQRYPALHRGIHFASSAKDCEERVAKRTDHPTIKFGGGRGAEAEHLLKCYGAEAPKVSRAPKDGFAEKGRQPYCGIHCEVYVSKTFCGAQALESPVGFFKFPTTPHVLDLTNGKALTESDRLLSDKEAQEFFDPRRDEGDPSDPW